MTDALALPQGIVLPAKNYRHVRAACRISNGVQPKDLDRLHVDLSDARGPASRVALIDTDIRASLGTDFVRCLLTGHTGCGKSTELRWLARQLGQLDDDQHRYHAIFVDADDYANVRSMRLPERARHPGVQRRRLVRRESRGRTEQAIPRRAGSSARG